MHVEGDETAEFGVFDVFLHLADEQGLGDHARPFELGVGILKIAGGELAFFVLGHFGVALGSFRLDFGESELAGFELVLHCLDFRGIGSRGGRGSDRRGGLEHLDLFFELQPFLLLPEFRHLGLETGDFRRRGVFHPGGHALPRHRKRAQKQRYGGAKEKFHRVHGRDGGREPAGCQRGG